MAERSDTQTGQGVKPWEQQPGETAAAFAAFQFYLGLGGPRSINEAYRLYTGRAQAVARSGHFGGWAVRNRWTERARQWDAEQARIAREAEIEATLADRQKWAERRREVADREWELAAQLISKAEEMLLFPTVTRTVTEETTAPDGRTIIQHITIEPGKWRQRDAGYLFSLATKMRRMAAEMATDRVEAYDPNKAAEQRLADARQTLADARQQFKNETDGPDSDALLVAQVAEAFGVSADDLTSTLTGDDASVTNIAGVQ